MQRLSFGLVLIFLCVSLAGAPGAAANRVALVIGNSDYKTVGALANPKYDAAIVSETLRGLGFEVIETINATQKQMKRSVSKFTEKLSKAGNGSVGLFYYAGHGIQVGGRNYLIPVDAEINNEADVDIESIEANSVLRSMEYSNAQVNFVILDACRNNPFARSFRSASRGLARMDAPKGSLVAYATSPGDVAADGKGRNSPYTSALVAALKSGEPVERMFRQIRNNVMSATGGKQIPWESSSLTGEDFYFNTAKAQAEQASAPKAASLPAAMTPEMIFWQSIKDSQSATDYKAYLNSYPSGSFSGLAQSRYIELKKKSKVAAVTPPAQPTPGLFEPKVSTRKGFKDCAVCPEMITIPGGRFTMGDASGNQAEQPAHQVVVDEEFAIGKYEVTFAEYYECVNEGECSHRPSDNGWGRGQRPVMGVNWEDARQFTRWLSQKTGKRYDLPTEAQWEFAARGGSNALRFWGDSPKVACDFANVHDVKSKNSNDFAGTYHKCSDGFAKTSPAGAYAANGFGLHDVLGNVWEWNFDCWHTSYENSPQTASAWLEGGDCSKRVIRGGAWLSEPWRVRSASRSKLNGRVRKNSVGFRVARYDDY